MTLQSFRETAQVVPVCSSVLLSVDETIFYQKDFFGPNIEYRIEPTMPAPIIIKIQAVLDKSFCSLVTH
jgi:hypothetical protein